MKKLSLHTRIHYLQCKSFGLGFLYSITRNRLFFDKKIRTGIVLIALMNMLAIGDSNAQNKKNTTDQANISVISKKKQHNSSNRVQPMPTNCVPGGSVMVLCYVTKVSTEKFDPIDYAKTNDSINIAELNKIQEEIERKAEIEHPRKSLATESQPQQYECITFVEEMPSFPGKEDVNQYIQKHLIYPDSAKVHGIQGRVITQFVVEEDGSITNVVVVRGVSPELDAEAIRIMSSMPKWNPGKQQNKPFRVKYTMPVNFKLPLRK